MNETEMQRAKEGKMQSKKCLIVASLLLAALAIVVPLTTPRANALAAPCSPKCSIAILSPGTGGLLNNNQTVGSSFLVSFLVKNFSLIQPGSFLDTNTTASGPPHNQGHIHVFVDGVYITIWTSSNGIPLNLPVGTHTIKLDLVNDFHQEFNPAVTASTTVNVADPAVSSIQSTGTSAQNNALYAEYFSLGALIVGIIALVVAGVMGRRPKAGP